MTQLPAPLAHLGGARPTAPPWFERALAHQPERTLVDVQGAAIESLAWGPRGAPGVLLLHGNGAHADWYSFIGPLLAHDHRVCAFSLSGMGGSGWRDAYSNTQWADEAMAVAEAAGLFASAVKPVFVGHSFGGFPVMVAAAQHGARLRAAVIVDTPLRTREQMEKRAHEREHHKPRPSKVYASLEDALVRFRFLPPQGCEHLYIADHIARTGLKPVTTEDGSSGWTWRFDPYRFRAFEMGKPGRDMAAARCPVAFMYGGRSKLMEPEVLDNYRRWLPPGSPMVEVPEAEHHVMVDQPIAFVAALRALLAGWQP